MKLRRLTEAEIRGIMVDPIATYNVPNGQIIFWGRSYDGRLIRVPFDPRKSMVITVVEESHS